MYASLVLVQPRKTRPYITDWLLMGRKESNQTNNQTEQAGFNHPLSETPKTGYKCNSRRGPIILHVHGFGLGASKPVFWN